MVLLPQGVKRFSGAQGSQAEKRVRKGSFSLGLTSLTVSPSHLGGRLHRLRPEKQAWARTSAPCCWGPRGPPAG